MDKGTIVRDLDTNKWVIINSDNRVWEKLPLHPYYSKYDDWVSGTEVFYQYSMECSNHFPSVCNCKNLKMYATPVLPQEKNNIFQRILKILGFGK